MMIFLTLTFTVFVLVISNYDTDDMSGIVFKNIYIVLLLAAIFIGSYVTGEKHGQKQALRGKFDYKMEIKYKLKDSVYTPVDTTFTEIKH